MRIAWFTENFPPSKGGMSRSCDRLVSHLRAHHTIDIYHFNNKHPAFSTKAQVNGSYTALPVFEDSAHTLNVLWAYIKNHQEVLESQVLVGFGSHLCIKGMALMATWLKKPLLICFRGNDFDNALFSQKKQDLLYTIEKASAIACVTMEKMQRIEFMELNDHVYFTPNSIDFNEWQVLESDKRLAATLKSEMNLSDGTKIIGLIGFLKEKKGIDFFIKTLRKSQLINRVFLLLVGTLEPHVAFDLERLGIPFKVVSPESKTELMAQYLVCDAVCIPSIYDGMPNVIFEAGALDIPIIASRAGGIPDVLDEGNAFLFDVLSEKSMLEALSQFDNASADKLKLRTARLRDKIQNEFSTEQETQNYLAIFEKLVLG